jgi:hypothetical protein
MNDMVMTYEEYIKRFIIAYQIQNKPVPGEHHFVSVFLMPRIFNLHCAAVAAWRKLSRY